MKLDILALAAHPDDAELSCVGTLLVHKKIGKKIGIVDLTQGELGSRGTIETRAIESANASSILGLDARENLKLVDGFFENNQASRLAIIRSIRKYQPDIVLANAPRDRHPDHGRASQLIKDACFLSGLIKIETHNNNDELQIPWRPKKVFFYVQDYFLEPNFIIDISDEMETKMESIKAFKTQFAGGDDEPATYISSNEFLDTVRHRNRLMGKRIGVEYGEGFLLSESHLGLKNFAHLVLPEFV
jgi:N-acetylglucosamine malate deacetylase 1